MQITFPDAYIRYLDIRDNEEAAETYCKVFITAGVNKTIRKTMGWGTVDENGKLAEDSWPGNGLKGGGKLEGELNAKTLIFTPNETGLRKKEIDVGANVVNTFTWEFVNNENSKSITVDFIARTSDRASIERLIDYKFTLGRGKASLKISYDKQEELPLEDSAPEASTQENFADV